MMKPGATTHLDIIRNGKPTTADVTIGTLGDKTVASNADDADVGKPGKLGVAVRPLAKEEQQQAGIASGLLVEQVTGRAARAGIEAGDVIVSVNGTLISNVRQLQDIVAKSGKSVALLVQRDSTRIFVPVDLG